MSNAVKHLLEFGPFRIDPEQRLLMRDQQPVPLSPKAFELLLVLAHRSGQVVLKDELMTLLWPDTFVEESNLGQHVFQLRKALGERAQESTYIVTVPGRGYRFAPRVRTTPIGVDEEIVVANRSRTVVEEETLAGGSPATSLRRTALIASIVIAAILLGMAALVLPTLSPPKVLAVR